MHNATVRRNARSLIALHRNLVKHLCVSAFLLAAFAFNFSYHDGWKDSQAPGDEPVYVDTA